MEKQEVIEQYARRHGWQAKITGNDVEYSKLHKCACCDTSGVVISKNPVLTPPDWLCEIHRIHKTSCPSCGTEYTWNSMTEINPIIKKERYLDGFYEVCRCCAKCESKALSVTDQKNFAKIYAKVGIPKKTWNIETRFKKNLENKENKSLYISG